MVAIVKLLRWLWILISVLWRLYIEAFSKMASVLSPMLASLWSCTFFWIRRSLSTSTPGFAVSSWPWYLPNITRVNLDIRYKVEFVSTNLSLPLSVPPLLSLLSLCSPFCAPAPLAPTVGWTGGRLLHPWWLSSSSSVCPTGVDEPERQWASEPDSRAAETNANCPVHPLFASKCRANFIQTFEMSPKDRMWIRGVFITWSWEWINWLYEWVKIQPLAFQ